MKELIDRLTEKKKEEVILKQAIENLTFQIQEKAIKILEDKNVKTTESFGTCNNNLVVTHTQKVDIVNLSGLQNHIDEELLSEKVTKKQEIKYEIDKLFKKALVILYQKDFEKYITLEDFITKEFNELDLTKRNTLCKKLKGEYKKDKELLQKYVDREDLDIELYYINKIKNYDIVKMFFDTEDEQLLEAIKKFITIDDNIKVTLKFE